MKDGWLQGVPKASAVLVAAMYAMGSLRAAHRLSGMGIPWRSVSLSLQDTLVTSFPIWFQGVVFLGVAASASLVMGALAAGRGESERMALGWPVLVVLSSLFMALLRLAPTVDGPNTRGGFLGWHWAMQGVVVGFAIATAAAIVVASGAIDGWHPAARVLRVFQGYPDVLHVLAILVVVLTWTYAAVWYGQSEAMEARGGCDAWTEVSFDPWPEHVESAPGWEEDVSGSWGYALLLRDDGTYFLRDTRLGFEETRVVLVSGEDAAGVVLEREGPRQAC